VTENSLKILLVEDNPGDAFLLREELKNVATPLLELIHVELLGDAIDRLNQEHFDVVLLDLSLPDSIGLDGLLAIQTRNSAVPIIVLTGLEDDELAAKAVRQGAQDYLIKGHADSNLLVRAMRYAIERKRSIEELRKLNRCLKVLSASNHALIRANEETEFLNSICTILVEQGGYPLAWVGYAQNDLHKTVRPIAVAGGDSSFLEKAWITWDDSPTGRDATGTAIRTGKYQISKDIAQDPALAPWREESRLLGFSSMISLPLILNDQVIGNLTILTTKTNAFDSEEINLLLELADDLAYGIQTLRTRAESRRANKALHETNALLEKVFASCHLLIAYMDRDFNFIRVNATYASADGHESEFYIGKNHFDLFPNEENEQIFKRVVETGEPYYAFEKPFEYARNPERGISYWDWSLLPVKEPDDAVSGLVLSLFNVSKRKRLEREILEISRREQRRIGQDLHDVLGQNLTGLAFLAKVLERKLSEKSLPETVEASKIAKLGNQAVNQTRALARGLCPVDIKADGLMNALQDFAFNLENLFGVTCHFQCKTPIFIHDNAVATHLYHIAQEAVNNAIKHGKADHVAIRLSVIDDHVSLTIHDNGTGLPEHLNANQGMGLHIMDYRARMIGASFNIRKASTRGTIVSCSFRNPNQNDQEVIS
jgi:PAS domain S-box-containing protein